MSGDVAGALMVGIIGASFFAMLGAIIVASARAGAAADRAEADVKIAEAQARKAEAEARIAARAAHPATAPAADGGAS